MKMFPSLIIIMIMIMIKITISDPNKPGQKEFQKLEKKAKALACSFLSNSFISSAKDYDKKLKEILKENKIIQNESEAKDKISQFILANCYLKITSDLANKIILDISKKSIDFKNNKQYLQLFEMDKNTDFTKLLSTMKELNELTKEMKAEEEIFAKKRKEDPNFEKNLKDFEERMKKNYEQKKNENNKNDNTRYTKKKKKGNGKKPYEGTKWEFVQSSEENFFHFKDIIFNPKKFFEDTGLNTVCGMIIMSLIFIIIFQSVYNYKNKKDNKKEDQINDDDINEINKENNDNEEEEEEEKEKEEENNINNENNNINNENNNINNMAEKANIDDKNIIYENKDNIIEEKENN